MKPKTVCANCGAPYSPPIGLYGTNDVPCMKCIEPGRITGTCYTAITEEEWARRKLAEVIGFISRDIA